MMSYRSGSLSRTPEYQYIYVVFTFWSRSVGFLSLQCLLIIFKGRVGFPLRKSHLILEWKVGFPLP